ncbi:MAG: hypothetical protein ACLT0Y_07365 [Christensenellales bacterium]
MKFWERIFLYGSVCWLLVYSINIIVVNHYIKVKAYQIQEQKKQERRRSSENRSSKTKADERLMKEVPKLKWTLPVGVISLLVAIFGFGWEILRLIGVL